jgi:DNA polymerase V
MRKKSVRVGQLRVRISGGFNNKKKWRGAAHGFIQATQDTCKIASAVNLMCAQMLRTPIDFGVKRITLLGLELEPNQQQQESLFSTPTNPKVMQVVDQLNHRFGKTCVTVGITPAEICNLHGRQRHCSPRYTTRWKELPVITID